MPGPWRGRGGGAVAVAVAVAGLAVGPRLALAAYLDTATASGAWTVTTETLQPPSGLTSGGCLLGTVTLTWNASPTTWAEGYEVRWSTSNGGPYGPATPPRTALTTYTVTGLTSLTTYYFVVRAYRGAWFSANSNQHSATCLV